MKKIKKYIIIGFINLFVFYFFLLIINLWMEDEYKIDENLVVNVKSYEKNSSLSLFVDKDNPDITLGGTNKLKHSIQTGKFGDILVETEENNYDKIDLLFMGGSTTECLIIPENKRFPFIINKSLNDSMHIVNLSKSGKNSRHSMLQLLTQLNDVEIKNLILLHNFNDLGQLLYSNSYAKGAISRKTILGVEEFLNYYDHSFFFPTKMIRYIKKTIFTSNPDLYKKIKKINLLEFLNEDKFDEFKNNRTKKNLVDFSIFKIFKNNLKLISSICRIRDINLILMTQFNRISEDDPILINLWKKSGNVLDYENLKKSYIKFNDIIRHVSLEENIKLIDLDSLIPKEKQYIYDMIHLTEEGSELVSKHILNELNFLNERDF